MKYYTKNEKFCSAEMVHLFCSSKVDSVLFLPIKKVRSTNHNKLFYTITPAVKYLSVLVSQQQKLLDKDQKKK